ncbi:MAG TPA: hypothetical protein VIN40_06675 [Candidatus Tyrphobacter sp.]
MSGATLHVELLAEPRKDVETGAHLSLTLLISNASHATARGVVLAVPVPAGASFCEGTLFHDAVRRNDATFFGDGVELPDLAPGSRTAFIWKLRVEEGDEPLRIVPQIWAGQTRAVGAEPLEILRRAQDGKAEASE